MDYIYSVLNTMGLMKLEDKTKFGKPDAYKNINTGQIGKNVCK
jgi:hypothetical protein